MRTTMQMQEIVLEPRACECCGGSDLEPVWSSESVVKRAVNAWRFPFNVAICRSCGFCFAAPGPTRDSLTRYYAEGLAGHKQIGLPYSIDARLEVLERYRKPDGVFAEIGGDGPGEFHSRCAPLFARQLVVEVSDDCPAELRSVHELPANSIDVIAHYDVLEHVTDVKDFLTGCCLALKPGGVMICEVPDIRLYARNLLLLEYEHVNHFSTGTLAELARQAGLEVAELGHLCSRPYGFLAVFRKQTVTAGVRLDAHVEFIDALACVRGGLVQIERVKAEIAALQTRIAELGAGQKKITMWGVTDFLRRVLDNFSLPASVRVVDMDPRRRDHLEAEGIVVSQPKDSVEHLAGSDLLVICAPRYKAEILEWVRRETGKTFAADALVVLGSGPSGETLS